MTLSLSVTFTFMCVYVGNGFAMIESLASDEIRNKSEHYPNVFAQVSSLLDLQFFTMKGEK